MRWQEIVAAGVIALASSMLTALFGIYLDRARERERRRSEFSARIIETFSRLNRLAETSVGLHGALAAAAEDETPAVKTDRLQAEARDALNDAWYASRDLDVVLPSTAALTSRVRSHLRAQATMANEQFRAGRHDRSALDALGDVREILDELATAVRSATGHRRVVDDVE